MSENSAGVNDGPIRRAKGWLEKRLPGAQERKDKEIANALEIWIGGGLELIKQGSYKQAMDYFIDEKKVKEFGFSKLQIFKMPLYDISPEQLNPQFLDGYINMIAIHSKLLMGGAYGLMPNPEDSFLLAKSQKIVPVIQLASPELFINGQATDFPELVYHNAALLDAEEFLHGLQYHKQNTITGVEDPEQDVAQYLRSKNVPLTREFEARYYTRTPNPPNPGP